jgi:hypothetical protein
LLNSLTLNENWQLASGSVSEVTPWLGEQRSGVLVTVLLVKIADI